MLNAEIGVGCGSTTGSCGNDGTCAETPDICIKRHDTRPSFRVAVSDCDGAIDLTDENLALEASMWFESKLKSQINDSANVIFFADNIGFNQVLVGDVIVMDRARNPEKMLVTGIDEVAKSVVVERAHGDTTASPWPKGNSLKVFRFTDAPAEIESVFSDVAQIDGVVSNELVDTFLVFNWSGNQTALSGCYRMEFKLAMISPSTGELEWTKRFPLNSHGFVINVVDSATTN